MGYFNSNGTRVYIDAMIFPNDESREVTNGFSGFFSSDDLCVFVLTPWYFPMMNLEWQRTVLVGFFLVFWPLCCSIFSFLYILFCRSLLVQFSFGHCIFWPSSIYDFDCPFGMTSPCKSLQNILSTKTYQF